MEHLGFAPPPKKKLVGENLGFAPQKKTKKTRKTYIYKKITEKKKKKTLAGISPEQPVDLRMLEEIVAELAATSDVEAQVLPQEVRLGVFVFVVFVFLIVASPFLSSFF